MPRMTEEEAWALEDEVTRNPPKADPSKARHRENMKNDKIFLMIILAVSISILLFIIGLLLYNIMNMFGTNYIWRIITFIVLSLLQIFILNTGCKRITEAAKQFSIDSFAIKQRAIELELSSGAINEQEFKNKIKLLQHEADFLESLSEITNIIIKIPIIVFVSILLVIITFIICKYINIEIIDDYVFNGIIQCGIISIIFMIFISTSISIKITNYANMAIVRKRYDKK
jgi:flagellar biosynthesis component FlhA